MSVTAASKGPHVGEKDPLHSLLLNGLKHDKNIDVSGAGDWVKSPRLGIWCFLTQAAWPGPPSHTFTLAPWHSHVGPPAGEQLVPHS